MEKFGVIRSHIGDDYIVPYDDVENACAYCELCGDHDELFLLIEFDKNGDFRDFARIACDFDKEGVLYLISDVVDLVEKNYPDIADEAKDGLLLGLEDYLINVLVRAGKLKAAIKQLKDRGAQRIFAKY